MSKLEIPNRVRGRFANPAGSPPRDATALDYAAFFARRIGTAHILPEPHDGHVLPRGDALAALDRHRSADSITWLGHAAFLLRLGGQSLLLDPYLSRRAGPGLFGPPRFAAPELGVNDFGDLDALLITHNHYDHLDAATLRTLPQSLQTLAPLGLAMLLRRIGLTQATELGWFDAIDIGGVRVTALPAIHWSKRGMNDENRSWWCGYLFEANGKRVYFAGDTGYGPVFEELGARWDRIDLGIVGIGAYEPRSIMAPVHTNPEEAIQIGRDMQCARVLGMHWGTVILSDEDPWEPPVRFRAAGRDAGYDDDAVWTMAIGETRPL